MSPCKTKTKINELLKKYQTLRATIRVWAEVEPELALTEKICSDICDDLEKLTEVKHGH